MAAVTLQATVQDIRVDTPTVYTLIVTPQQPVTYQPGQFFFIYTTDHVRLRAKAYSVANMPGSKHLEFCIKRVDGGYMSNKLHTLTKGETITIGGPYGFFTLQPVQRDVIFIATGTGLSAIRPMIHTIFTQGTQKNITLLFGVRTQQDLLYREEWEQLAAQHPNFHFIPTLSKEPWQGHHEYVQDLLPRYWKGEDVDFYICGLPPMVDTAVSILHAKGVKKERIHLERYT